jgi:predicted secreted protein
MKRYSKSTSEIHAKRGTSFAIELDSLPGAGYSWRVGEKSDAIRLESQKAVQTSKAVGGSTSEELVFVPESTGEQTLILEYGRPWEDEPQKTLKIRVVVD